VTIENACKLSNNQCQKGFTLIEALIAFSIGCTLLTFFPIVINMFYEQKKAELNEKEVELFFTQAGKEIREAITLNETWRKLEIIKQDGKKVTYERYGTLIRRQVNEKGHEVMLQNVKRFSFFVNGPQVEIVVTGNGDREVKRVFSTRNTVIVP
jgi:competence protein ComGF